MLHLILLILCFFIFIEPSPANASTYYVAKSGSDSNTCAQAQTISTPKLTVNAGRACLGSGDTVLIRAGTYVEFIDGNTIPSGTAAFPTVISAYQSEVVTLRPTTGGVGGDVVWFSNEESYITFRGVNIDATNVSVQGIRITNATHHIRIENLEVMNAPASNCIGINDAGSHHFTFTNLHLHNCGANDLHHGIYLRGQDHIVENSNVHDISGSGIIINSGISGMNDRHTIRNNRVYHNGGEGILLGSGDDNVAYNNIVYNNGVTYTGRGIRIYSGTPRNNQIYNNTIYGNTWACIEISSDSTTAIVKNNVCWQNAINSVTNAGTGSTISNNLTTDPKFNNLATLDFRVTLGSPAIDGGTPVLMVGDDYFGIKRPQGLSYDIGAHEWSSQDVSPPLAPVGLRIN